MQIYGPYRVSTTQPNSPTQRAQSPKAADAVPNRNSFGPTDQLDLTSNATSVNRLNATQVAGNGEIRIDRVAELRRQIADGSYDTAEKVEAALDKFLDQYA